RLGEAETGRMPAFDAPGGVKLSAGWLIERAGFGKGHPSSSSPARLSTKHALALTNRGAATADDVIALAREVRDGVREAFGVELRPSPSGWSAPSDPDRREGVGSWHSGSVDIFAYPVSLVMKFWHWALGFVVDPDSGIAWVGSVLLLVVTVRLLLLRSMWRQQYSMRKMAQL